VDSLIVVGKDKKEWTFAVDTKTAIKKAGKVVGFFSLEDSWPEIVRRMVKQGRDFDLDGMHIMDRAGLTIDQIIAAATTMRPDVVLVDYVQLVASGQNRDNRVLQVGDVTRGLKILAKDLGVPVVAAAQLGRKADDHPTEPTLSDFRESGSIEQDADIVVFITRTQQIPYQHTLIVGKNRHGPTGTVSVVFMPSTVTFGLRAFDN
jgi:replicative DNA helicase